MPPTSNPGSTADFETAYEIVNDATEVYRGTLQQDR